MNFTSIAEVKKAVADSGSKWFEPKTMRFFHTKIESDVIAGKYFITSEVNPSRVKGYTVRVVTQDSDGNYDIGTVGEFHKWSKRGALSVVKEAIAAETAAAQKEVA